MGLFDGIQSVFNPRSPQAAATAELMWVLIAGATIVFVAMMLLVGVALWKRPAWLAHHRTVLAGGVAFPAVTLAALLVYSLGIAAAQQGEPAALRIEVIGHQWWWQVRYRDAAGELDFETANEIRIPVGRAVDVALISADVLHSFWVPTLAGKLDLVPGRTNRMQIAADRPGVFRGQCAEYCGGPHAQMALYVIAEPDERFEQWRQRQRAPAAGADALFLSHCAVCHAVRGTDARGTLGPDLTHVGSRWSIGAGILPNSAGTLAEWIVSNQHIKPGNLMPAFTEFGGDELARLATYLESLR